MRAVPQIFAQTPCVVHALAGDAAEADDLRARTMKARMGATHFLTKTLPKVATEMAVSVLASSLTRVMNILGVKPLMAAIEA